MNLGDARHGGALRPSRSMNPTSHWNRDIKPDFDAVIAGLDTTTTAAAVFDNRAAAEDFVKAVKEADLGLSINISTSIDGAEQCCDSAGICPPQRRLLARLRRQDRAPSERGRPETRHHVRSRHGQRLAGQEDDRLGEGRPPHTRAGRLLPDPLLLLRRLQPVPREADSRRGAHPDEVISSVPESPALP